MTGGKTTRLASLQIVMFVLAGFWLLIQEAGSSNAMFVFGVTGLLFGIGVVFRAQQTDITRTIASLLVPIIGVFLLAGFGALGLDIMREISQSQPDMGTLAQMLIRDVGISVGIGIAIFGAIGTIAGGVGDRGVSRLGSTAFGNLLTVGLFLSAFIYFRSALLTSADVPTIDVSQISKVVLQPTNPGMALVSFWLLVFFTAVFARFVVSAVPVVELAPRRHEDRLKQARDGIQSWLGFAMTLLILLGFVAFVLFAPRVEPVQGYVGQLRTLVREPLFATVHSEGLRVAFLAASAVFVVVATVFKGLQYLTGSITSTTRQLLPAVIGGLVAIAIPIPVTSQLPSVVSRMPQVLRQPLEEIVITVGPYGVLLVGIAVAIAAVVVTLLFLMIAGGIRLIPLRSSSSALAASGLAIGAIVLALVESTPFTVLAVITLSILTWNVGERGVTTRTELGTSPSLTLETLHSLGGVIIAVPAAAIAWWIQTSSLASLSPPEGTAIGVIASVVALGLLLGLIKG